MSTIFLSGNEINEQIKEIEQLIINDKDTKKIVAIGEIGLDYHWNTENKQIQKLMFQKQIELANKYNLHKYYIE